MLHIVPVRNPSAPPPLDLVSTGTKVASQRTVISHVSPSITGAKGGAKSTLNFNERQQKCHDAWKVFDAVRSRLVEQKNRTDSVGFQTRLSVDELPQKG